MIKRKNSEFYLLEPLKSPGLIRSFFDLIRRNFEQLEVPRKNAANQLTGQPKCCPPGEEGSLSIRALVKELYPKLFLDGLGPTRVTVKFRRVFCF